MITERYSGAGVVFYDGPSQIDGTPIIGVATGFAGARNTKTGPGLRYCMASADSPSDRAAARMLGFRTFRVRGENDPLEHGEVQCPAAKEAGFRTTCDACVACGGHSAKAKADISIVAHGALATHYLARHSII